MTLITGVAQAQTSRPVMGWFHIPPSRARGCGAFGTAHQQLGGAGRPGVEEAVVAHALALTVLHPLRGRHGGALGARHYCALLWRRLLLLLIPE